MKFKYLLLTLLITATTYGQSIQLQYSAVSANEIRFEGVYEGESTEIIIPTRGRLLSIDTEHAQAAGSSININTANTPVRFTYSFITTDQSGFGSISEEWFPKLKENNQNTSYSIISADLVSDMLIFPYQTLNAGRFTFGESDNPKIVAINHTFSEFDGDGIKVSAFSTIGLKSSLEQVEGIYNYFKEYFGSLDVQEIVLINNRLVSQDSFVKGNKLYILVPNIGTIKQLQNIMADAWESKDSTISPRIFGMLKDSVIRLSLISEKVPSTTEETEEIDTEEPIPNELFTLTTQNDSSYILPVAQKTYYEDLFAKGFSNNTIVNVNAPGIISNFGLLHMSWAHLGIDNFLTGIKGYFNSEETENGDDEDQEIAEDQESEEIIAANTNDTNTIAKADHEQFNWSKLIQNKVQEPYYSLYTKEVLRATPMLPVLKALGSRVSRNSYNIPNLALQDTDGNVIDIDWGNFRVANIEVKTGSYDLDPERKVPQFSTLESYYSFNTNEQQERRLALFAAEKIKAPGERNLKQHLEMISFTASADNGFDVAEGTKVYVIVSHILSSTTGLLKDAFKESFIAIDPETKRAKHLGTRLRI